MPPPPVAAARPGLSGGSAVRLAVWVTALTLTGVLAVAAARRWTSPAESSEAPVEATCDSESQLKSATGGTETMLQVANKTAEPVVVHWINFQGTRERWFEVRPGASRSQRTPPGYRWVVARPDGACLAVIAGEGSVVVE
jgi:hypothetical protein